LPFFPVASVVRCPFTLPLASFVTEPLLCTEPFLPEASSAPWCETLPPAFFCVVLWRNDQCCPDIFQRGFAAACVEVDGGGAVKIERMREPALAE
jgi:hypothetical protein